MNQITKEELLPYVAHNVNAICVCTKEIRTVTLNHFTYDLKTVGINHLLNKNDVLIEPHKLLLRPLYQLTNEIEVNGEKFVPIDRIRELGLGHVDYISNEREYWIKTKTHTGWLNSIPYVIIQKLLSWHFNVFNLHDNLYEKIE